jgi:hypothetical protein
MKTPRRSIHLISQNICQLPKFKRRMYTLIWEEAELQEMVSDELPMDNTVTVHPARLHADLTRMMEGQPAKFPESRAPLERIKEELMRFGFEPRKVIRSVWTDELGVTGVTDAEGVVNDLYPALIELKCVRFIPQVIRAAESAQLILYSLSRRSADPRPVMLAALYVQPCPPYRVGFRWVMNQNRLEPIVRELAAA